MSTLATARARMDKNALQAPIGIQDEPLIADAERIACDLLAQFQRLSGLAAQRQEAIKRASPSGIAATIAAENDAVQQLAEIEKRRITVVGRLAERLGAPEKSQTKLSWIAARLGPAGERLARRAAELREAAESLRRVNEVARAATQQLAGHMEGLWRQAAAALNHSKTYGRIGRVDPGAVIVSGLDVRS